MFSTSINTYEYMYVHADTNSKPPLAIKVTYQDKPTSPIDYAPFPSPITLLDYLNILGEEGWMVGGVLDDLVILQRPSGNFTPHG